jgi:hypothetical protein
MIRQVLKALMIIRDKKKRQLRIVGTAEGSPEPPVEGPKLAPF